MPETLIPLIAAGEAARSFILSLADLLKTEWAPGFVSIALVLALLVVGFQFTVWTIRRRAALRKAIQIVETAQPDARDFGKRVVDIGEAFDEMARSGSAPERRVAEAWKEYRETTVDSNGSGLPDVRNSLRPSLFFNLEDLDFSLAGWRLWPGLFVSFGLALTFLGLISALNEASQGLVDNPTAALGNLLTIASAKFIMSLTGLVCSILFTVALRFGAHALDGKVHRLCTTIEKRVTFVSLEDLAERQLAAIREQTDQMQRLNTELVAELGRPLREELPAAITQSIREGMAPVMDRVGQVGSEGVAGIVERLSEKFTNDVSGALAAASGQLTEAGNKLQAIAERLEATSGGMGRGVEDAVGRLTRSIEDMRGGMVKSAEEASGAFSRGAEDLLASINGTLERIRENTADGSRALSDAARKLTEAATSFREEVNAAGAEARTAAASEIGEASGKASAEVEAAGGRLVDAFGTVARQAEALSQKTGEDLLRPLEEMRAALERIVGEIGTGTERMARLSAGIERGAGATQTAADGMERASTTLRDAAAPIQGIVARIESASDASAEASRQTAEASRAAAEEMRTASEGTARRTVEALEAAREILGAEKQSVEAALEGIQRALERFGETVDRYDQLDENLGAAFQTFRDQVERTVADTRGSADAVYAQYTQAVQTLQAVVDELRDFEPESRRR